MAKPGLVWKGNDLLGRMEKAQEHALNWAAGEWKDEARRRVRQRSGNLHDHIEVLEHATALPKHFRIKVGTRGVPYAMAQEKGLRTTRKYGFTPYLKPSFDIVKRKLAKKLKEEFKKNGKA
jgi:hypothetical protein